MAGRGAGQRQDQTGDQSKTLTIKIKHQVRVLLGSSVQNTLILFDTFGLFI